MKNDKTKTVLVSWSGGLDSTYLIYNYLKQGHSVIAFYTKLLNNDTKTQFELNAINKLCGLFIAEFGDRFEFKKQCTTIDLYVEIQRNNMVILPQPPVWLLSLFFVIDKKVSEVAIGYVMHDCAISFLQDIRRLYKAYQPFFCAALPKLVFPLIKETKEDIWRLLPKNYYLETVTCENPGLTETGDYIPCFYCTPCKHKLEFDLTYRIRYTGPTTQVIQIDCSKKENIEASHTEGVTSI